MRPLFKAVALILCLFSVTFASLKSDAQVSRRKRHSVTDSLRRSILRRDSLMRVLKRSDTSLNNLVQRVEYYNTNLNQITQTLNRGFDTAAISTTLPRLEKGVVTMRAMVENDKSNTLRYLYAIRDIFEHLQDELDDWQSDLSDMNAKLVQTRADLKEISSDSVLHAIPADTSLSRAAALPVINILKKYKKLDSLNRKALIKIGLIQNRVAAVYINIIDEKDLIDLKIRNFSEEAFSQEYEYMWAIKPEPKGTFKSAWNATVKMNSRLFKYSLNRDTFIHITSVICLILFLVWLVSNRRKIVTRNTDAQAVLDQAPYVARFPLVSAIIVATTIAPYLYDHPPVVLLEAIGLVDMVCLLILVKKTCSKNVFNYLHLMFYIMVLLDISNLFVQVSNVDRIAILLITAISILVTLRYIKILSDTDDHSIPYGQIILKIFTFLQILSLGCNIMGRFSVSKIIAYAAIGNLWQALALYLTVQILLQSLFLQLEGSKKGSGFVSYLDYKTLQNRFRSILNLVALAVWLVTLAQNLSIEDYAYDTVSDFLTQSRKVGGTAFTFGSLIIFAIVIWLSAVIARIISYFYDFAGQQASGSKKKTKTSILLVRITVFTIGFFVAVAASGFPLDKITIILSAFGVGIGFGLQNIVNNLVSGLILAFEKPVQVGDIIEVENRSGKITDIGIRSSKIETSDGAEVIVPNGDLIAHHVINWTLSNNNRRVELLISVAYGSEIDKVKRLIHDLLITRTDIMQNPPPLIFLHNLSQTSVDFRVLFWVSDISTWLELKSRILADIYAAFGEEDIEIPIQYEGKPIGPKKTGPTTG
jgi:small-conductance mechanosensitive channel